MLTNEQRKAIEWAIGMASQHNIHNSPLRELLTASAAPAEGREPTVWAVYNGVCLHDIFQIESGAREFVKEMQLLHDRCASPAKFRVEPRILATAPTMGEADAKDATRYRWLRAQHEMKEEFEDAEGFVVRETVADAWTVFRPGSVTSLEPVGCIPGELDAAIDAEIERIDRAAAKGESDE